MTNRGEELFDLFVAHGVSTLEIISGGLTNLHRQIGELRREEPDKFTLSDSEIANMIWDYARNVTSELYD